MVQTTYPMKTCLLSALVIVSLCVPLAAQDSAQPGVDGTLPVDTAPGPDGEAPIADPMQEQEDDDEGPAIPVAYDLSRYEATWDKNPFLLKTKAPTQPTVSWVQDWALAGMYSYKGKIQISIRNKQTNEMRRITNTPKEGDEFRFVEANFHRSRREASAKIAKGSEEGILKYDENAAPVTINNTLRQSGGPAGQQGGAGMPNQALPGRVGGQPMITKPVSPTANGRVFNATTLPGGVTQPAGVMQGGMSNFNNGVPVPNGGVVVQPNSVNPTLPVGANGLTPAPISRRRQLIPAPVVTPPSNP
jgi:hypothetical protein